MSDFEDDMDEEVVEDTESEVEASPAETGEDKELEGRLSAVKAERSKRQEAERREAALLERIARLEGAVSARQQATKEQQPEDDIEEFDYSDPKGWALRVAEKVAERKLTAAERRRAEEDEKDWQMLLAESVEEAREAHEDFDEVAQQYLAMERANPGLARLVRKKADPAEWAYRYAKKHGRGGDAEKRIAELEQEVAALRGGAPPLKTKTSVATVRGSGAKKAPSRDSGGSPFGDAFGGR